MRKRLPALFLLLTLSAAAPAAGLRNVCPPGCPEHAEGAEQMARALPGETGGRAATSESHNCCPTEGETLSQVNPAGVRGTCCDASPTGAPPAGAAANISGPNVGREQTLAARHTIPSEAVAPPRLDRALHRGRGYPHGGDPPAYLRHLSLLI